VSYAGTAESEYQSYSDQGYIILCMMLEGDAEVQLWTETYGMTFPVLSDQAQQGGTAIGIGGGIPHHMLIGRDMTARVVVNPPSSSQIEAALAEEWPEVDYPVPPTAPEVDDSLPDESADAAAGNPFGVASVEALAEGSMCAVGDAGGGRPWAVALLLGVLALRRRR